jgi:hypothetical protein
MYGPLHDSYVARVEKGMRPTMARLTLARKIATITLTIWKKGEWISTPKFAAASSLSISGEEGFPSLGFSPVVVGRVREMLDSRVSISQ